MKKRNVYLMSVFSVLLFQQELMPQGQMQSDHSMSDLFDIPEDIELADVEKVKVPFSKKIGALKDMPFYCKLLCSYVYKEKLCPWYRTTRGRVFKERSYGKNKKNVLDRFVALVK